MLCGVVASIDAIAVCRLYVSIKNNMEILVGIKFGG